MIDLTIARLMIGTVHQRIFKFIDVFEVMGVEWIFHTIFLVYSHYQFHVEILVGLIYILPALRENGVENPILLRQKFRESHTIFHLCIIIFSK